MSDKPWWRPDDVTLHDLHDLSDLTPPDHVVHIPDKPKRPQSGDLTWKHGGMFSRFIKLILFRAPTQNIANKI